MDRRLRRDLVWNLVPVVLLAGVGLGLNFLIGRWWGPAALGVFTQVTTAFFVFSVLAAAGLQFSVLRAVAENVDDAPRVAAVSVGALVPTLAVSLLATAGFLLIRQPIGHWLDSEAVATGMLWAAPGLVFFALNKVLLGIVNGLRRMRAFAVYTSLRYLLIAGGLVLARVYSIDPSRLAGIWTFAEAVLFCVLVVELVTTVSLRRCRGWIGWAVEHARYGARGVFATLAYEFNSKADVWLIGVVLPDRTVGIYSLASALAEGVQQLAVVLQNNLNPLLARAIATNRPDEVEVLVRRSRRWFVPAFVGVCVISAASYPFIVPWLIGDPSFGEGAWPFAVLIAGIILCSGYLPFNTLLLMAGRPGSQTVFAVIVLALHCAGNFLLVPIWGTLGAGIASAAALAASAMLLRYMVYHRLGARI